jgi:hypothetical protein
MKKLLTTVAAIVVAMSASAGDDVYAEWRASWLRKAEEAKPVLMKTVYRPVGLVTSVADDRAWQGWHMEPSEDMDVLWGTSLRTKKSVTVDFGRHLTGYFTFHLKTLNRTQDGPIRIKFTFAEVPAELNTPFDPYPGALSRAWLQDEVMTIMNIDRDFTIPRRLSGRYMKIELLGAPDFDFAISDIYFTATSSASDKVVTTFRPDASPMIRHIAEVSIATLAECMQTVYEDGPKRDQRLWIGDMYLEALANTYSFGQHDLTKRCLYLLAALAAEDGRLHANVFERPEPHPQYGSHTMDYSLIYNVALLEYLKITGDKATALDLWPVVKAQVADAMSYLDDNYIFDPFCKDTPIWLVFDWRAGLDTRTMMQGCMIWALKGSYELAEMLGKTAEAAEWPKIAVKMSRAARKYQFDARRGVFVSGPQGQVSCLSQAWMILAEVLTPAQGARALQTVFDMPETIYPGAPYAYHYLIEALVKSGLHAEANCRLVEYWGGIIERGADTFWEVYDPLNPALSPYNFFPVNSYCHAWSCTPVYFIHKYPDIFQRPAE